MWYITDDELKRWTPRKGDLVATVPMSYRQALRDGDKLGTVVDAPEHDREWLNVQDSDGNEDWFHRTQIKGAFRNEPEPTGAPV